MVIDLPFKLYVPAVNITDPVSVSKLATLSQIARLLVSVPFPFPVAEGPIYMVVNLTGTLILGVVA